MDDGKADAYFVAMVPYGIPLAYIMDVGMVWYGWWQLTERNNMLWAAERGRHICCFPIYHIHIHIFSTLGTDDLHTKKDDQTEIVDGPAEIDTPP